MNPTIFLKEVWINRKERNPSYSLSAFARDIGLSQPLLSKIFSGNRALTPKMAYKIGRSLKLGEKELLDFIAGTIEVNSDEKNLNAFI